VAAVVDTSVLIDQLLGRREASDLIERELGSGEPLFASVLTKVEVLAGVRDREREVTRALLDAFVWVDVTDDIAERAGTLAQEYRRSHPGIDLVDFVVAATTEEVDAELWTLNVRHFPMIPGLASPY